MPLTAMVRVELHPTAAPAKVARAVRLVAFARYGGALAEAIRRFKFQGRPDLGRPLGELLRRVGPRLGSRYDLVLPVPLHPTRLAQRGYNQAALLGAALARDLAAPLRAGILTRIRATTPQASLGGAARRQNLSGALAVRRPKAVRGRRVLLVDDVATTTATLAACARALVAAGAGQLDTAVLALAERYDRASPDGPAPIRASW